METKKMALLLYVLLFISFSTSVYLLLDKITKQRLKSELSHINGKVNGVDLNDSSLWNNYHESINSSMIKLTEGVLVKSFSNDTFLLQSDSPVLIFYIPHENCSVCIEDELIALKARFPKDFVRGEKIIILREIENLRYWKVLETQIDRAIFKPLNGLNKIPFFQKQIPFYFILENSKVVSYIFVPDKNEALLRSDYFNLFARMLEK